MKRLLNALENRSNIVLNSFLNLKSVKIGNSKKDADLV